MGATAESPVSSLRAAVTGATGLIGRALCRELVAPVILSRAAESAAFAGRGARVHRWSPVAEPAPAAALTGIDAVFHLAGEPVAGGRWTAERRRRIHDSRVLGTRHLVAGLAALERRPAVLVSASAIGYYGDRGDELLDEGSRRGSGFLAEVCAAWEREAMAAAELGVRVVCLRVGIVLAADGGALPRMLPAFRLGLGGPLASGRQWMSWIHLDDVVGLLLHAGRERRLQGPVNAVAPAPVTNAEFTRALGEAVGRPARLPVPALALRAAFGEMAGVLTGSQRVLPRLAPASGYDYAYGSLGAALASLLAAAPPASSQETERR